MGSFGNRQDPPRGAIPKPHRDRIAIFIALVAAGVGIWACRPIFVGVVRAAINETRIHEIRGQVVDDTTGTTVAHARVVLLSTWGFGIHFNPFMPGHYADTTWTDDRGEFRLRTRLAGSTWLTISKAGYFVSSDDPDLDQPIRATLLRIPDDAGHMRFKDGVFPGTGLANPFRLDLERGIVGPSDPVYDVSVHWGPNPDSIVAIVAAPGRSVRRDDLEKSRSPWIHLAVNVCEAPLEGYADSIAIRWDAPECVCFVRRDSLPQYGAFTVRPTGWFHGPSRENDGETAFGVVLNRGSGRGLCNELGLTLGKY